MVCDLAGFDPEFVHAQFKKNADRKGYFHQRSQFPSQSALQEKQVSVSRNTKEGRCA
jgi:hypothetical protein